VRVSVSVTTAAAAAGKGSRSGFACAVVRGEKPKIYSWLRHCVGIILYAYRIQIPIAWQGNTCRTHRSASAVGEAKLDLPVALRLMLSASMADREVVTRFWWGVSLGGVLGGGRLR
jgi:hypothetical protein